MNNLTLKRLKQVLSYNKATGLFRWRLAPSNRVKAGDTAGYFDGKKHIVIGIDGHRHPAHRLAIFYVTGEMPILPVDHINGCGIDNRFSNLREVTPAVNAQNTRRPSRNNKVGLLGVYQCNETKRYRASIRANGIRINLGRFDTPEAAHIAYVDAKRQYHQGNTI